mmetsp:Transcript_4167/g.8373  ORF Transcript_4167/g.8373 Transcript_4167/m.8373 type:complete len:253 (-) Transcript_4167:2505-3263(-)
MGENPPSIPTPTPPPNKSASTSSSSSSSWSMSSSTCFLASHFSRWFSPPPSALAAPSFAYLGFSFMLAWNSSFFAAASARAFSSALFLSASASSSSLLFLSSISFIICSCCLLTSSSTFFFLALSSSSSASSFAFFSSSICFLFSISAETLILAFSLLLSLTRYVITARTIIDPTPTMTNSRVPSFPSSTSSLPFNVATVSKVPSHSSAVWASNSTPSVTAVTVITFCRICNAAAVTDDFMAASLSSTSSAT